MEYKKEKIVVQSHLDSTDISRLKEVNFNKDIFLEQDKEYIPGLFDIKDAMGLTDVWTIKDKAKICPIPLKDKNRDVTYGLDSGSFCERPSYFPKIENSYIYPLGQDDIYRFKIDNYLGVGHIPLERSEVSSYKEGTEEYNASYQNDLFSTEIFPFYLGSAPCKSPINNKIFFTEGKTDWSDCWSSNSIYTPVESDFFFAPDLAEISGNSESTNDVIFSKTIENIKFGTYSFSFYVRVKDTLIKDGEEEIDYRLSDISEIDRGGDLDRFLFCKTWISPFVTSDSNEISIKDMVCTGANISSKDSYIQLDSLWRRVIVIFSVNEDTSTITVGLKWPKNYSKGVPNQNRVNPIRVCGFLLENQDYPSVYKKEFIRIQSSDEEKETKYIPLPIYFGKDNSLKEKKWTISYSRYIEASGKVIDFLTDTLCNLRFGYYGNRAIIQRGEDIIVEKPIAHISDFLCHIEHIFITRDNESLVVKVFVEKGNEIRDYELTCIVDDSDFEVKKVIETEKVKYHLLCGGTSFNDIITAYYKDVVYFPGGISDEEINKIISSYLSVGSSFFKGTRDFIFIPDKDCPEITWEELKNLSIGRVKDCYKLKDDSTDDEADFKKGEILVCSSDFDRQLIKEEIPSYWTRTLFEEDIEDINNCSVFTSPLIIEGFEKFIELEDKDR